MSSGYLLDTNVISQLARTKGDQRVVAFVASIQKERSFLSVLTLGELRRGAAKRRGVDRRHAERLDLWIDSLEVSFARGILPVDLAVARIWGELSVSRPRAAVDTLIAATALAHDLTLVTRNVRDVADTGVTLVDPWNR